MTAGGWAKQSQKGLLVTAHHPSSEGAGPTGGQGSPADQGHREIGPLFCQTVRNENQQ